MSEKVKVKWYKNPLCWVVLISIVFGLLFVTTTLMNYLNWSLYLNTDLAAKYGDFVGGFFGSIVGVINLILLYHIFKNQDNISKQQLKLEKKQKRISKEQLQISKKQGVLSKSQFDKYKEDTKKSNEDLILKNNIDLFDSFSNDLNLLIENKLKLSIYTNKIAENLFYSDDSKTISLAVLKENKVFNYLNRCFFTVQVYIFQNNVSVIQEPNAFNVFLSNIKITSDYINNIKNNIKNSTNFFDPIEDRNINNFIPFKNFNFNNPILSAVRCDINYRVTRYPYFIHPTTLGFLANFESCLYFLEKLNNIEIIEDNRNKIHFDNYKESKIEYFQRLLLNTIDIDENVFLINYYLYDFDKFLLLESIGIFNYLKEAKLKAYFYQPDNLFSDYIKIKEYLNNDLSTNS